MSDETVSLEEALEDKQRETPEEEEHLEGLVNYAKESRQRFDGEALEEVYEQVDDISVTPPGYLSTDRDIEQPDFGGGGSIQPDIDFDLDEIVQQIQEGGSSLSILRVIALIQLVQLQALSSIRDSVRPISNITVSGTNAIEDADTPEPVVPRSDETGIPTKQLFIRASGNNSNEIWFGDDEVEPDSGFTLEPGAHMVYPVDLIEQTLWMSSEQSGETVELMGMI